MGCWKTPSSDLERLSTHWLLPSVCQCHPTSTKILITLRKWFSSNIRNNQTTTNASWHTRHAISAGTACVSLQRGLPRQPGPQSHRTDWRNNNNNNYHTATISSNCSSWPSKTRRRVSLTTSSINTCARKIDFLTKNRLLEKLMHVRCFEIAKVDAKSDQVSEWARLSPNFMIMKANNHHLCALLAGSSTIAAESGNRRWRKASGEF